ncbi:MAG: DUF1501 domain-containing protein [Deinococcus sp.]|nr:DUF1501 domain-containing protein [Deinococcus sp.]
MDRRDFLKKSMLALALGQGAPTLLSRTALAASAKNKILVVVQLNGGNDTLNTLIPFRQELYYRARPNIAIKKEEVLDLGNSMGLHPSLRPLIPMWESGELALVPQVGYPNASRSHFVSMAIWHTADPSRKTAEGWLGRQLDDADDPFCFTNLGNASPLSLQGATAVAPSISSVDGFQLKLPGGLDKSFAREIGLPREGTAEMVRQSMVRLTHAIDKVGMVRSYTNKAQYPNHPFAKSMADVARMIASNFGSSVYYSSIGSFDTHAGQPTQQGDLLGTLAQTLAAFRQDMKAIGRDKDVMVLAFSEFGRRVSENASYGTDHGKGGLMFAIGGGIKGAMLGSEPDLEDLDEGDLRFKTDFRSVYTSALNWIQADPKTVLGADFKPVNLF